MVGLGVPGRAKFLQVSVSKLVFTNGKVLTFCFSWGRSMEKSLFHGFLTGHPSGVMSLISPNLGGSNLMQMYGKYKGFSPFTVHEV